MKKKWSYFRALFSGNLRDHFCQCFSSFISALTNEAARKEGDR
ncbi:hypothetical protein [Listeria costaricensis]|nr:hypothetical protein [Listeria costaricensis]